MVNDLSKASEPAHVVDVRELLGHRGGKNVRRGRWAQSLSPAKRYQRQLLRDALASALH